MKYEYLVAYLFKSSFGATGTGRTFVTRDSPIDSQDAVLFVEGEIRDIADTPALETVAITSFQLLRKFN